MSVCDTKGMGWGSDPRFLVPRNVTPRVSVRFFRVLGITLSTMNIGTGMVGDGILKSTTRFLSVA